MSRVVDAGRDHFRRVAGRFLHGSHPGGDRTTFVGEVGSCGVLGSREPLLLFAGSRCGGFRPDGAG